MVFIVGNCVQINRGVFKGQFWTVIGVLDNGNYDIQDREFIIRNVRGSYLEIADLSECK